MTTNNPRYVRIPLDRLVDLRIIVTRRKRETHRDSRLDSERDNVCVPVCACVWVDRSDKRREVLRDSLNKQLMSKPTTVFLRRQHHTEPWRRPTSY
ncbi:hypothetical protein LSH36_119g10045 [Paralvinella palmiformis]|uniref:Uncharacterized protein n=1 Tax=Paralvinella palmiformis TaxID=53620 RepID=A0AAD9NAB9_9ANNE|nr:hypothetical protein LSH36_119g10045 [Paralvinella palmiformis]